MVVAKGGKGGAVGTTTPGGVGGAGGLASASTGDIKYNGQKGSNGMFAATDFASWGGGSRYTPPNMLQLIGNTDIASQAGIMPGQGAAGGNRDTVSQAGAVGADGLIIVESFA